MGSVTQLVGFVERFPRRSVPGVEVGRLDCSGGMVRKGHDGWSEAQRSLTKNDGFRTTGTSTKSVGGSFRGSFWGWGVCGSFLFWERCDMIYLVMIFFNDIN